MPLIQFFISACFLYTYNQPFINLWVCLPLILQQKDFYIANHFYYEILQRKATNIIPIYLPPRLKRNISLAFFQEEIKCYLSVEKSICPDITAI